MATGKMVDGMMRVKQEQTVFLGVQADRQAHQVILVVNDTERHLTVRLTPVEAVALADALIQRAQEGTP